MDQSLSEVLSSDIPRVLDIIERNVQSNYGHPWQTATVQEVHGTGTTMWCTRITVPLPQDIEVEVVAKGKRESYDVARSALYKKLKEVGALEKLLPRRTVSLENTTNTQGRPSDVTPFTACGRPSTQSRLQDVLNNVASAKTIILSIYDAVCRAKSSDYVRPLFETQMKNKQWLARMTVNWPAPMVFNGVGKRKTEAEGRACVPLINYLSDGGYLDRYCRPIIYSDFEKNALLRERVAPVGVALPADVVPSMEAVLEEFEGIVQQASTLQEEQTDAHEETHSVLQDSGTEWVVDLMTGRRLQATGEGELKHPDPLPLKSRGQATTSPTIPMVRQALPIFQYRKQIVEAVENSRVVILAGETGSGKTTQVPQYILEDYITAGRRSSCNIVVTQPRRISAISMAERVAYERGEEVGETIGYHVRLQRMALNRRGGILYCTTGILLRHLQGNPCLEGISHVVVDEVHERDLETDFLLILLREVMKANPYFRVIIMSATLNADTFSDYFGGAPLITIPGRLYPVKEYFLEEMIDRGMVSLPNTKDWEDPVRLVSGVVTYIYYNCRPGAILCFLPGWAEITSVLTELYKELPPCAHSWLLPLHSKLRHDKQWKIFDSPPSSLEGVRKVILATNIAETSITVGDVVYVVDTGLLREQRFDCKLGVPLLGTFETSRASMMQRKGRAGRLQPGECYYLFKRCDAEQRQFSAVPEMLRVALTEVVLSSKLFCPGTDVEFMLAQAPDPPSKEMILKAIADLQAMGIMNAHQELTELGRCVVHFPMAPQLSKAVVYATLFMCVKTVSSLAAMMSETSDLFGGKLRSADEREAKASYEPTGTSDHVALMKIYCNWDAKGTPVDQSVFCHSLGLNSACLEFSKGTSNDIIRHLRDACLIDGSNDDLHNWNHPLNANARNATLLGGVLTASFYPGVLRSCKGTVKKGQLLDQRELLALSGRRAVMSEESVIQLNKTKLEHPWYIYFGAMRHFDGQRITVYDATEVSSLHLLLFAGLDLQLVEDVVFSSTSGSCSAPGDKCLVIDGHEQLAFRCSARDADLIARWRNMLAYMVELHLMMREVVDPMELVQHMQRQLWPRVVELTAKIFAAGHGKPQ